MKNIKLNNETIAYTLRKSRRARRMRLAVYCDGSIVVTTPFDIQESITEKFIREKAGWLFSKINFFKRYNGQAIARHSHEDYVAFKDSALVLAKELVEKFNQFYCFSYKKINIKNQKTRWGSCSKKGNLNFNYKIALLPKELAEYVVIHELCHLKEFNHSKRFWALVSKLVPDYIKLKEKLKRSGIMFN